MIVIRRDAARAFRAVARKCVAGRPRGPAPPVVLRARAGTLSVWCRTADAGVLYQIPCPPGDATLVVPMAVLAAVEGPVASGAEVAVGAKLRGVATWHDRGEPQSFAFDALSPGKPHLIPDPPDEWHPVPAALLTALHECGRTAAKEGGRFALHRVQLRGTDGRAVGTDGKVALLWGGLKLPFADAVLVPAVPAFAARELAGCGPVRVARAPGHLAVGTGPWAVFLPIDAAGRFPDVAAVVPKGAPAVAGIGDRDAGRLLDALPRLPGADQEGRPVTLDLAGGVVVRARDEATGAVRELRLRESPAAGPPARVALDRRVVARALVLGCVTVRVADGKPVVFEGGDRTLVAVALDPSLAVPPDAAIVPAAEPAAVNPLPVTPERSIAVKPHETNGHPPNGRPDPPPGDPPDLLAEAEALRAAVAEVLTRAGRLVAAVKAQRKEKKALTQVWAGLRQLNLDPGGRP